MFVFIMFFVNTRNANDVVSFMQAVLYPMNGLRSGLYVPSYVPKLNNQELIKLSYLSYQDILFEVVKIFCNNEIDDKTIKQLINNAFYDFEKNDIKVDYTGSLLQNKIFGIKDIDNNRYITNGINCPTGCINDFGYYLCSEFINYFADSRCRVVADLSMNKISYVSTAFAVSKKQHLKGFILMDEDLDEVSMDLLSSRDVNNITFATVDKDKYGNENLKNIFYFNRSLQSELGVAFIDGINILNILAYVPLFITIFCHARLQKSTVILPADDATLAVSAYISVLLGCSFEKIILCCEKNDFFSNFQSLKTISFRQNDTGKQNITNFTCDYPVNFERLLFYLCKSNQTFVSEKMEECIMERIAKFSDSIVTDFCYLFDVQKCDNGFFLKREMHNFLKKNGQFCDQNFALLSICCDNSIKSYNKISSVGNIYLIECLDFRRNINFIEDVVGFKINDVKEMCQKENLGKIDTIKINDVNSYFILQLMVDKLGSNI